MGQPAACCRLTLFLSPLASLTFPRILPLLAAALAVTAYLNTLDNPFVFDDRTEVVENVSIQQLTDLRAVVTYNITRPVTNLTYAVDYRLWGAQPFGFHLTNLLLHVLNTWLLFRLVRHTVNDFGRQQGSDEAGDWAAFVAAGLFAVHPLMTEAVGYVSGRAEVLAASLFLAATLGFRRALVADPGRSLSWTLFASLGLFLIGLGAKETMVMLPVVLVAFDLLRPRRPGARPRWSVHVPLLLIVLVLAAARVALYVGVEQSLEAGFNPRHVLLILHVVQRYLFLLALPLSQSIVPEVILFDSLADARLLLAAAVVGGVMALAIRVRAHHPLVTFGVAWWFLLLIPSSALLLLAERGQPMAEHRIYLASCGVFIACAGLMLPAFRRADEGIRGRTAVAVGIVCVVLTALTVLTVARNEVWSDPVRLWADAVQKAPNTWIAHQGLAAAYTHEGACDEAVPVYEKAIALRPEISAASLGLAQCLADLGQPTAARDALRKAITHAPSDVRPRLALASLEEQLFRRFDEALRICQEVVAMQPGLQYAQACVDRNRGRLLGPIR